MTSNESRASLDGVKVLDLSRFIAGPFVGMMLGDLGADVVKIEGPRGEDMRRLEPFVNGKSVQAMAYNRNKRGFTTDTRSDDGRSSLLALAEWADVVIENFRPGVMEAMGLGYETLNERDPTLVMTSISGFGQYGPYVERPLFDPVAQAMSGMMVKNAMPDGTPKLAGVTVGDHVAGLYATVGTLAALAERERSGLGQHVDVSVFDSLFSILGFGVPNYALGGRPLPVFGNRDGWTAPAAVFQASDGAIFIHAGTQNFWQKFCGLLGRDDLLADERFATVAARVAHEPEVEAIVEEWAANRTCAEIDELLTPVGVPCGTVADSETVASNPQVAAREMLVEMADTDGDRNAFLGNPIKLSRTPIRYRRATPGIGEHNDEIDALLAQLSEKAAQ